MRNLIDISMAQPVNAIDWIKVKSSGIDGVYVRCGEGLHSKDPCFEEHSKNATDAGLRVGAYYVIAPSTKDPHGSAAQAMSWSLLDNAMPLVIDIERNRPLGADAPVWCDFINKMAEELKGEWIPYTYTSFRTELSLAGFRSSRWMIAQYPPLKYPSLQAEAYRASVLKNMVAFNRAIRLGDATAAKETANARARDALALSKLGVIPEPVGTAPFDATIWQWGGDANACTCTGVQGLCDRSYFLGTDDEWTSWRQWPKHIFAENAVAMSNKLNPK